MLPGIQGPFNWASGITGAAPDEVKLLTSFLLSYPLAGLLKRIPDDKPWAKNAFNIFIAVFYLIGLFDLWSGLAVVVFQSVGTYAIAANITGPYMPWVSFVFNMGYMSISHIYRQIAADPSKVDITGAQMVLVMKLTAFAWNVFDGTLPEDTLDAYQKDRRLTQLPGFVDFAGFVAFFPSFMIGPAFDYAEYDRWLKTSMFDLPPGVDAAKAPATRGKRRIPRSGTPAMFKAGEGIGWIIAFLFFSPVYTTSFMLGDQYKTYNLVRKIFILYMFNFTVRMKYYGVWSLTEGACILSGIGFKGIDPKTGKAEWDRLTNIRPFGVELAQNSHAYLGNWNINTNHWLRNYIYLRVTPKGKKPGFRATMATFVTSAFWHGFYPGYYLSFVLGSFVQNMAKQSRRLIRPFFMDPDGKTALPNKRYYDVFTWLITQISFAFVTTPFILLTLGDSLAVWARVYFYLIIGLGVGNAVLLTHGKTFLRNELKKRSRPGLVRADSHDKQGTYLGLPGDPGGEWDEMVEEVSAEMERRKREGKPITDDLRKAWDDLKKQLSDELERRKQTGQPIPEDLKKAAREKLGKDI